MNNQKSYCTKQKNYIQDLFMHHPDLHFTAEQILKTLEEGQTPVSKATLYRTLDQMVDAKKIVKYNLDGASACYQYLTCSNEEIPHIHFKCEKCGKIIHMNEEKIQKYNDELEKKYGIAIDLSKTVLYGICDTCICNTGICDTCKGGKK